MNAMQIMKFLVLLNLCISAMTMIHDITNGHFYDVSSAGDVKDEYDVNQMERTDLSLESIISSTFGISSFLGIVSGIVLGSVVAWATKIPADRAFAYSTLSTFYIATSGATISLLWSFTESGSSFVNLSLGILVTIFVIVIAFNFVMFVFQLITGGWQSYQ